MKPNKKVRKEIMEAAYWQGVLGQWSCFTLVEEEKIVCVALPRASRSPTEVKAVPAHAR
jgi:hypothetical protein